jgi:hypothetical protein
MLVKIAKFSLLIIITFFLFVFTAKAQWQHRFYVDEYGQQTNLDYAALPTEPGFILNCKSTNVEVSAQVLSHFYQSEFYVVFNLYDDYGITEIPSDGMAVLTATTRDGQSFQISKVNGFILKGEEARAFMNFVSAQKESVEVELQHDSLTGLDCSYIIDITPIGSSEVLNQLDQV